MTIPIIRPYRPADHAAVYDICIRTADSGQDARSSYPDHDLVPSVFAGPYLALQPDLAFVLDSGDRAVGYILGTADTGDFVERYRAEWLPTVAARFPESDGPAGTPSDHMTALLHHPEHMLREGLVGYPAHLHIDLLPDFQGAGHGRRLMTTFLAALRDRGVPGVHLMVANGNTAARAFYARLGFHELPAWHVDGVSCLGRRVDAG